MELVLCAVFFTFTTQAAASTWNIVIGGWTEHQVFFFDADSVVKQGEFVTVWLKYVKTGEPDKDGSWSSALRTKYDCSKLTMQTLSVSAYDKTGKFVEQYPDADKVREIVPDSLGAKLLVVVCAKDFPNDVSGNIYSEIRNNDVYAYTKGLLEYLASKRDLAPK